MLADIWKSGLYLQMAHSGKGEGMQPTVGYIIECLQTQRWDSSKKAHSLYCLGKSIPQIKKRKGWDGKI